MSIHSEWGKAPWKSVKDERPSNGGRYLVTRSGALPHWGWTVDIALYLNGNWYCGADYANNVVAWAPLPMPYTSMSGQ